MKKIVTIHPAPFCGGYDESKALIEGLDKNVRYNVCPIDADEGSEGSACILVDYDPEADYASLYRVTDTKTHNPQ